MKTTTSRISLTIEFAARVERGQHGFQRRLLGFGMSINGNSTTVVFVRAGRAIFVQSDGNLGTMAGMVFIDAVVPAC